MSDDRVRNFIKSYKGTVGVSQTEGMLMQTSKFAAVVREEAKKCVGLEIERVEGFEFWGRYQGYQISLDYRDNKTWTVRIHVKSSDPEGIDKRFVLQGLDEFGIAVFKATEKIKAGHPNVSPFSVK